MSSRVSYVVLSDNDDEWYRLTGNDNSRVEFQSDLDILSFDRDDFSLFIELIERAFEDVGA